MKLDKIRRIIRQILIVFPLSFTVQILSAYFWGHDLNVQKELIDAAVFSVLFLVFTFCFQRNQRVENAQDDSDKTE